MTEDSPSIAEITALTRRLRELSAADADAVVRFLADKRALLDRITEDTTPRATRRDAFRAYAVNDAVRELARARAASGGYAQVGPSARIWHTDQHGRPTVEASEAEHRAVRALLNTEELDIAEPAWVDCGDGQSEIVSCVVPAAAGGGFPDVRPEPPFVPTTSSDRAVGEGRLPSCLGHPDERERREQSHRWAHDDVETAALVSDSGSLGADPAVDEVLW